MTNTNDGLPASVHARLLNRARATGLDNNRLLERYALERFLYRLGESRYRERFILKGGLMMLIWFGEETRPTRDADLLGQGDLPDDVLSTLFGEICDVEVAPDGMTYDAETIAVADIRETNAYGGRRVTFIGHLGTARLHLQVDVGIGDAVTPPPQWAPLPPLLEQPVARLRAYPPETAIAEKLQIIVAFGMANSRMKDFFDIVALTQKQHFDGERLIAQVSATFKRRNTPIPTEVPIALTDEFSLDHAKQAQWAGFVNRDRLSGPRSLQEVTATIRAFAMPVFGAARSKIPLGLWPPGGPWPEALTE